MSDEHEPLELFTNGDVVRVTGTVTLQEDGTMTATATTATKHRPTPREAFLTGLLAQWAASDRAGQGAKATVEERRRAAEGARAALGEILR